MAAATVFFFLMIFVGVELILCKFQVYSSVNQLYINSSTLFQILSPGRPLQSTEQSSCAIQQVLLRYLFYVGFPGVSDGKRICLQCRRPGFDPWVRTIPWKKEWQPAPIFLPGESHGLRSLMGCSPGVTKSQTQLSSSHFHFVLCLVCICQS